MGNRVYLTPPILQAIHAIENAGHGIELEMGEGGNNHSVTYIIIGVCHPQESGYIQKLRIKHTSRYSGKFSDFSAMSVEFGEMCYSEYKTIDPFLEFIDKNCTAWLAAL